jgi:hypothetical protein
MKKKKEFFRRGRYYLIDDECIGIATGIESFHRKNFMVRFKIIARQGHTFTSTLTLPVGYVGGDYTNYYNRKGTVEETKVKDFPLYLWWHYKSDEFMNILRGETPNGNSTSTHP